MSDATPYQFFEDLPAEQFAALKADIRDIGVQVPVVVDQMGIILDGHHRVRAWTELKAEGWDGADYPRRVMVFRNEAEKRIHARTLNLLRRQLTKEQVKAHAIAMRADGATLEATAAAAGVDPATVMRWTRGESTFANAKVEGKDGKARPATYRPRAVYCKTEAEEDRTVEVLADVDESALPVELTSAELARRTGQPHVAHNSGENEWYTPAAYVEAARRVMGGIDLDPASTAEANAVVKASRFYTMDDDGLEQEWAGRVFLNPPYATGLVDRFTRKLIDSQNVTQAVVLSNNATETRWFQDLAQAATALCFPRGRIRYWSVGRDSLSGLQGQVFIYLGDNHGRFLEEFGAFGFVVEAL